MLRLTFILSLTSLEKYTEFLKISCSFVHISVMLHKDTVTEDKTQEGGTETKKPGCGKGASQKEIQGVEFHLHIRSGACGIRR